MPEKYEEFRQRLLERNSPQRVNVADVEQVETCAEHMIAYELSNAAFPSDIYSNAETTDKKIAGEYDARINEVMVAHNVHRSTFGSWWFMRDSFSLRHVQDSGDLAAPERTALAEAIDEIKKRLTGELGWI